VAREYAYDGFASHATDPDGPLVRAVEALLEGFHRRPYLPAEYAREIELCVDGRDFVFPKRNRNADGNLDAIEPVVRAYQKRSRSLIVFCGPLSHNHPWIDKEIQWWVHDRPKDPIYFALTHGADPANLQKNLPPSLYKRGSETSSFLICADFTLDDWAFPRYRSGESSCITTPRIGKASGVSMRK
jgi:hypothetical protein